MNAAHKFCYTLCFHTAGQQGYERISDIKFDNPISEGDAVEKDGVYHTVTVVVHHHSSGQSEVHFGGRYTTPS